MQKLWSVCVPEAEKDICDKWNVAERQDSTLEEMCSFDVGENVSVAYYARSAA